ncbi:MAG: bifunctional folylpolyglutamate synthase/dihydrofolate synthase, partial [Bacteroidota bacterium]
PETACIFINRTKELNSEIVFADQQLKISGSPANATISQGEKIILEKVQSPLLGNYQLKNIITVVASCELLGKSGITLSYETIRLGIEKVVSNTGLKGRWQTLSKNPLTICDTGHNEAGIREVLAQLKEIRFQKLHFVLGMVNDKEISTILLMLPKEATYYFCKADIPRGLPADQLKEAANKVNLKGTSYFSVKEALAAARRAANRDDLVFVGGSTFVVAEVV